MNVRKIHINLTNGFLPLLLLFLAGLGCDSTQTESTKSGGNTAPSTGSDEQTTSESTRLTVYSGRTEELIGPAIEKFRQATGIDVQIRYAGTAELAALLLEEGTRSPADVFIAQDSGALGAVAELLSPLTQPTLDKVDARFRSPQGTWIGLSGRARVVVYNSAKLSPADLPETIQGFTDPKWRGRLGWAPQNGSFQAFITAMRMTEGEAATKKWLEAVRDNEPKAYARNMPIVQAVGSGEIEVGLVNHYYLLRAKAEQGADFPAANHSLAQGGAANLINVSGAGILKSAKNRTAAERLLNFLLSEEIQTYFAQETFEYPLASGVPINEQLTPLDKIQTPEIDLADLGDLEETLELLQAAGVLN